MQPHAAEGRWTLPALQEAGCPCLAGVTCCCTQLDELPGGGQALHPRLHDSQQAATAKRQQSGTYPARFGWSWMSGCMQAPGGPGANCDSTIF
eukprot:101372-Pelagomonas_calceolata.AAC.1